MVLVDRFRMSVAEIVMAYSLVEQALAFHPSLLRCYSVRPIFLGCCVLAFKMTREHETSLSYLHSLVSDVFNLLEVGLLIRIEHQLLEVLDWRMPMPVGTGYQEYADAVFCTAAEALVAPPMPAPQILLPWETPVDSTPATDAALAAISNAQTREASFKVASTGPSACVDVTAADEAACEAAGADRTSQIVAATPYPPPPSPSPSPL